MFNLFKQGFSLVVAICLIVVNLASSTFLFKHYIITIKYKNKKV